MIRPFLSAYNKRTAKAAIAVGERLRILIDGHEANAATTASSLLLSEEPRVELFRSCLPSEEDSPSGLRAMASLLALDSEARAADWRHALEMFNATEAALAASDLNANRFSARFGSEGKAALILMLLQRCEGAASAGWDAGTTAQALRALRILSREATHDSELRTDRVVVTIGRMAGLAEDGVEWTEATAEACVLLNNLMILGGDRPAQLLRDQLGAEPRVLGQSTSPLLSRHSPSPAARQST